MPRQTKPTPPEVARWRVADPRRRRPPEIDEEVLDRIWEEVHAEKGRYDSADFVN
jgi:hypothetical protein